ncbi:fungal-specific transcription factor domain protein [Aspergillus campestris IBT 28561]|uniref:Fungal-specific transcription factor domain protein n=1 Tax=Aspergillus campestris (strain IBT 28561) TaxID=1392248 RepID=A0A2I1D1T9_ASPC2|nr:fungal-specific transcription factor domain protein [Aspergillus campestris IBT 28561]PKY03827.1 fungal-specific transcription factor domain protein [Aspergillus campestris IBT 28561]
MEAEGPETDSRESLNRRACDQCRLRKIRCDKRSPCSNCRSSNIVCRSTGAGRKPHEQRQRVLISSQYERKIDLIEKRLGNIEQILHELKAGASTTTTEPCFQPTPTSNQMSPSAAGPVSNATTTLRQHEMVPAFEGNSSLSAHSAYASEFLESAVSRSALQMSTPKIGAALATLKKMVNMQDNQVPSSLREARFPSQKVGSSPELRELAMPPSQVVLSILRRLKEHPSSTINGLCPFVSSERLVEACREVYFATEDYSQSTFIVVNGCLYYLFEEFTYYGGEPEMMDAYSKYSQICRTNLEIALARMSLLMPVRDESIEALALGAIYAIEISKPSFAFTLSSTASRLCQALGYHRSSSMEHDTKSIKEKKIRLFWSVYCLDKPLALRLGRASTFQDYDISLPWTIELEGIAEPWGRVYQLWIKLARIQGQIYEQLYSPAALCQAESERAAHARHLAAETQWTVMEPFAELNGNLNNVSAMDLMYLKSDEVTRQSIVTLIYRAIPPPVGSQGTFLQECIETARSALECHHNCMSMLKESTEHTKCSYLHWAILFSPFVPFIVLFCHTIEVSSQTDLHRLEEFVTSLEPHRGSSEAIDKMHRLCQVLSSVARLYLEAKAQARTQESDAMASVGQEFDTYLSALGLAPAPMEDGETTGPMPEPSASSPPDTVPPSTLGNWYSGNQHMVGLLEEDLSLFDPSVWS